MNDQVSIRKALIEDCDALMRLIKEFANYIEQQDKISMDEHQLKKSVFEDENASILIAEVSGHKIGYALYYPIFSSFSGKVSLYLEDLYISPLFQHKGYGKAMLNVIREVSVTDMDGIVEWKCLRWNSKAKAFYEKIGATFEDDTVTFSLLA